MITFKFGEEIEYANYYADKLSDKRVKAILSNLEVVDANEAIALSKFFWNMVRESIKDEEAGLKLQWDDGAEFWNEKLLQSISGYLERVGYEAEWDEITDAQ